jgi:hypothetical protein
VLIRDHVMDESRLHPPAGVIFAINMLVNTSGGETYTLVLFAVHTGVSLPGYSLTRVPIVRA